MEGQKAVASNQKEEWKRARDAYENARKAGMTGSTLATLKAAMDAAEARLLDAAKVDSVNKAS